MLGTRFAGTEALVRRLSTLEAAARARIETRLQETAARIVTRAAAHVLDQRDPARPLPSPLADSLGVVEGEGALFVTARAPYAAFVELGTARAAAEPFLGPAFDAVTADLARDLARGAADR